MSENETKDPELTVTAKIDGRAVEEQVVHALADRILRGLEQTHDPDFDEDEPSVYRRLQPSKNLADALRVQVKAAIAAEVSKAFNDEVRKELRTHVKAAIQDVADRGMPSFNRYGERQEAHPWPKVIAEALEGLTKKSGYHDPESQKIAREVFTEVITKAMNVEVDALKKKIREAVDEQLSGSVIKALREAVGLR